ncbi:MAG: lysine--tRNA ligase [Planctomycetaceae bacterium]|jgi:lysyl-tRNA synthetase class 2|nr:lysine--tRNA ligase [Planctomycetaceae bacterium]
MSKEKNKERLNAENNSDGENSTTGTNTGAVLEAARREKLRKIEELGFDPWGCRFDNHQPIDSIRKLSDQIITIESESTNTSAPSSSMSSTPATSSDNSGSQPTQSQPQAQAQTQPQAQTQTHQKGPKVRAAGRIILQRKKGKLIFLDLWDWTGKIQVLIGANQVGEKNWELAQCFDLGDIIGVDGELMITRAGELSIAAESLMFLSKSIETPPAKFHGLTDPDLRSRMRYMDLIHTDGVLERMLRRTKIVQSVRATLSGEGFVEVEGPTLHTIAGGAAARPFATHHNTLNIPLVLRIALELHLKRLLVGGMERVYELGRVYRNEGIDQKHNPEFTMLEAYQAYGDCRSMMDLTEKIIVDALKATGQDLIVTWNNQPINFTPPFARRAYDDLIKEYTGVDPTDRKAIIDYAKSLNIDVAGKHFDLVKNEVFEAKVEDNLLDPIFVTDYPASICPLTKRKPDNAEIADRFELFVQGVELANAYTELNDPDLQETLFSEQLEGQKDDETMAKMDKDFIRALRHGMPPAGGLGIGIDRLCMFLTNTTSIKEVILFPLQRPDSN